MGTKGKWLYQIYRSQWSPYLSLEDAYVRCPHCAFAPYSHYANSLCPVNTARAENYRCKILGIIEYSQRSEISGHKFYYHLNYTTS